jgi:asparagine N-glycosylation enzyme membrane subunit Stt3
MQRMQRKTEATEKGQKEDILMGVPSTRIELSALLLTFLGVASLIGLLTAPQFNLQGALNIVALAALPIAYGVWKAKKWALYAALILLEPLMILYPLIAAFSPYFQIEYSGISVLSVILVGLAVMPLLVANEHYAEMLKKTKIQPLIEKLPVFNVLFIIFGVALVIRTVLPYDTVFKDSVRFASDDAVYHMRLVENALFGNHFPTRLLFDSFTYFPHGTYLTFAPLYELIIIFATWIITIGKPTIAVMETVGAYYPAVLGSLVIFPAYVIGRELYNKYAGLIAAVLVATLPGQFLSRSIIGFTDHHVAEIFLSTLLMMFLILALKRAKTEVPEDFVRDLLAKSPAEWVKSKNFPFLCYIGVIVALFYVLPWAWWMVIAFILFLLAPLIFTVWHKPDSHLLYACLAGITLGFYLFTWYEAVLFIFVIFVYGVIHYTVNGLRGEQNKFICAVLIPVFSLGLIMLIPFYGRPFPYDIRHIASLSMGIITFSIPIIFYYITTREHPLGEGLGKSDQAPRSGSTEYICPICGKKARGEGIIGHVKTKHSGDNETKSNRRTIKQFLIEHPELSSLKKSGIQSSQGSTLLEQIAPYEFLWPGITVFLVFVASLMFFPQVFLTSFKWFVPQGSLLTIAENHPMDPETAWGWFGAPFFISLFALAILVMNLIKGDKPEEVALLIWSTVMVILVGGLGIFGIETIGMNRFAYYYAINAAILSGFFAAFAFDALSGIGKSELKGKSSANLQSGRKGGKAKRRSEAATLDVPLITFAFAIMIIAIVGILKVGIYSLTPLAVIITIFCVWMYAAARKRTNIEAPLRKTLAVLLISVIVFYPFPLNALAKPFPSTANLPLTAIYAINTAERGIGADEDWYEALRWMRNNTPEPGVDYYGLYEEPPHETTGAWEDYDYPESAYGVMSWWDYGHMITWIAHRIPNANPFQQGIGGPIGSDNPGACVFLLAATEADANKVADTLGVRYVISDYMMADIWNSLYNKYGAMTVWAGDPQRYSSLAYYYTTVEARLHMFDGASANVDGTIIPALAHYRLVHESPTFVLPLVIMDESTGNMYWRSYSGDYATTAGQAQILHGHLFSFNAVPWLVDELNNETLPEFLASAFNSTGIPLSAQSTVSKVAEGRWAIRDEVNKNVFIIKEQEGMLDAYLYGVRTGQENIKAWTPEYLQAVSFVKTFEYVPGAHVMGAAFNGSEVQISTDVTTNQGRSFSYALEITSDGAYEFILPYATEGPVEGGTQFDTTVTPYTIRAGHYDYENETMAWDVEQELRITDEDVMTGRTITLDLL